MTCNSQASTTSYATYAEYQAFIQTIDEVESRIVDDTKFPVVKDNKIKICCKTDYTRINQSINKLSEV